jgi:tetratricopeptide (TPR) repeat protein
LSRLFEAATKYKPAQDYIDRIRDEVRGITNAEVSRLLEIQITQHLSAGQRALENDDFVSARQQFEAILVLQPSNSEAQKSLGETQQRLAVATEALFKSGLDALQAGHYEKAEEFFSQTLALNPEHAQAKIEYGKVSVLLQTVEEARQWQTDLDALRTSYIQSTQAAQAGELEKSYFGFKNVLQIDPLHRQAGTHLRELGERIFQLYDDEAHRAMKSGQYSKAAESLKRALVFDPDNVDAKTTLEEARRKLNLQNKSKAERLYRKGLEAIEAGNARLAIDFWQSAVDLDPENLEAQRGLERLKK